MDYHHWQLLDSMIAWRKRAERWENLAWVLGAMNICSFMALIAMAMR